MLQVTSDKLILQYMSYGSRTVKLTTHRVSMLYDIKTTGRPICWAENASVQFVSRKRLKGRAEDLTCVSEA